VRSPGRRKDIEMGQHPTTVSSEPVGLPWSHEPRILNTSSACHVARRVKIVVEDDQQYLY
jgi:hypothetical protein